MKSKLVQRLLTLALAFVIGVGVMVTPSLAAEGHVNEIQGDNPSGGRIVVTLYNQTAGNIGTGAEITGVLSNPVEGVTINTLRIGSVVELTTTDGGVESRQIAYGLDSEICSILELTAENSIFSQTEDGKTTLYFAPDAVQRALNTKNNTESGSAAIETYLKENEETIAKVTGNGLNGTTKGVADFQNLRYGLYLMGRSELTTGITPDLAPFLVSVPMYVENGTDGAWQSTVYAYPKVRISPITFSKTTDLAADDRYVSSGDTIHFTLNAVLESTSGDAADDFTSFAISDTSTGNVWDIDTDHLVVKLGLNALTPVDDYTVTDTESGFIIELTKTSVTGGLAELNQNLHNSRQTITVEYSADVSAQASFTSQLINTAVLSYQDGSMPAPDSSIQDVVTLYTYGVNLNKTLSDGKAVTPNTISFELYTTYNNSVLGGAVPIQSANGGYCVAASGTQPENYTMYVDSNGTLKFWGLEPGTYYLKETATMSGYNQLTAPIAIVISDSNSDGRAEATVNGTATTVTDGMVSLSVVNTRKGSGGSDSDDSEDPRPSKPHDESDSTAQTGGFDLTQTGGGSTIVLTAVGLGLLCVGVILLIIYRRSDQKKS